MRLDVLYNENHNLIIITDDETLCDKINARYNIFTIYWIIITKQAREHIHNTYYIQYEYPDIKLPVKNLDFMTSENAAYYEYLVSYNHTVKQDIRTCLGSILDIIFSKTNVSILNGELYVDIICAPQVLFRYNDNILWEIIKHFGYFDKHEFQRDNELITSYNACIYERFVWGNNGQYSDLLSKELGFWYSSGPEWFNNKYGGHNLKSMYDAMHIKKHNAVKLPNTCMYISLVHANGFYTFGEFDDVLQKLYILDKYGFDKSNIKFVCHRVNKVNYFEEYFKRAGYNTDQLVYMNDNTWYDIPILVHVPNITFPTHITYHTRYWLAKTYSYKYYDPAKKYRLYLSRNEYYSDSRKVNNELEIIEYLKTQNFIIVSGSEPYETILEYFTNATCIIYPHGSLIRNNIFCINKVFTIEFCANNRVNYSFVHMSNAYNAPHKHNIIEADDKYNFDIDLEYIKTEVEKIKHLI